MMIKEEGQRITYSMLEALAEKIEIIDGKLEGAEEFLLLSLYGLGIRELLRILPEPSTEILIDLLKVNSKDK
ncbi:hypothetical protein HNR63_002403 [Anoxybacillus kamchatkensis]|uniref:hypothetical protein n=1 Tax=Anoxybacillus ayderensis TaxID=265546 RepID=UPI0015EB2F17|nr:hypothetical protein [Anoxybacillus ayderensis]MBA2879331.1 hypothetical protein [Anoxybacillus ayderensis]